MWKREVQAALLRMWQAREGLHSSVCSPDPVFCLQEAGAAGAGEPHRWAVTWASRRVLLGQLCKFHPRLLLVPFQHQKVS